MAKFKPFHEFQKPLIGFTPGQGVRGQIFTIDKQCISDMMLKWQDHYEYSMKAHYIM